LFDMGKMMSDIERLLLRKVDIVTRNGLKRRIREHVLREARPL
jgi:predicted nucleotidyltransferase